MCRNNFTAVAQRGVARGDCCRADTKLGMRVAGQLTQKSGHTPHPNTSAHGDTRKHTCLSHRASWVHWLPLLLLGCSVPE